MVTFRVISGIRARSPGCERFGCWMAALLRASGPRLEGLPSGYPKRKFQSQPTVPPGRLIELAFALAVREGGRTFPAPLQCGRFEPANVDARSCDSKRSSLLLHRWVWSW